MSTSGAKYIIIDTYSNLQCALEGLIEPPISARANQYAHVGTHALAHHVAELFTHRHRVFNSVAEVWGIVLGVVLVGEEDEDRETAFVVAIAVFLEFRDDGVLEIAEGRGFGHVTDCQDDVCIFVVLIEHTVGRDVNKDSSE